MVYLDHKIGKQLILLPNLGVIPSSNNTAKQNTADYLPIWFAKED